VAELSRQRWRVGSGSGKRKETSFRIGDMGEVMSEDLEALLEACDQAL
jgi:aspartate aminotransferase-like enzyme